MEDIAFQPLQPKVVLGVAAHPDDLEFGASGTIAKFIRGGAKAYYLILTDASKGTSDRTIKSEQLTRARRDEQREAAKTLGVSDVFFGAYEDGALEVTQNVKRDIVRAIRRVKPDVVITMDPTFVYSAARGFINHPDHRAAGQATLDAVYPLARDHLAFPELLSEEGLEPHKTPTVLLVNFDKSNYYVDITDTIDVKLQALAAHASQLPSPPDATLAMVRGWAEHAGGKMGSLCAESFVRIDIA